MYARERIPSVMVKRIHNPGDLPNLPIDRRAVLAGGAAVFIAALTGCEGGRQDPTQQEPTPSETPTGEETTTSPIEAPVDSEAPIAEGPFGPEYAPLQQTEHALEPLAVTHSIEEMDAISTEEFAMLPVQDRLYFLIRWTEENMSHPITSTTEENFVPDLVVDTLRKMKSGAFVAEDPDLAAKLGIAGNMYLSNPGENHPDDIAMSNIEMYRRLAEERTEFTTYSMNFVLEKILSVRTEEVDGTVVSTFRIVTTHGRGDDETTEAVDDMQIHEVLIQRPDTGETVITFAKGLKVG
jgi:hypothetical protein